MSNIKISNIEKLLQSESSENLIKKAFKALKVEKKDRKSRVVIYLVCGLLALGLGFTQDTVEALREASDTILNVLLALFGIIFTGYALIQAFMDKHLLVQLINDSKKEESGNEKSRLQDINESFVYLIIMFIMATLFTLTLKIALTCIPNDFIIFQSMLVNNFIAALIISMYFFFLGIIFWRIMGFISTIYHLFNAYAVAQIIEMLSEEHEDD